MESDPIEVPEGDPVSEPVVAETEILEPEVPEEVIPAVEDSLPDEYTRRDNIQGGGVVLDVFRNQ